MDGWNKVIYFVLKNGPLLPKTRARKQLSKLSLAEDKEFPAPRKNMTDRPEWILKREKREKTKTKKEFNIVMSGQFSTLAMFSHSFHWMKLDESRIKVDENANLVLLQLRRRRKTLFLHIYHIPPEINHPSINHRHRHSWAKMLLNYPSVMWDS